jgi:hypothetical protein
MIQKMGYISDVCQSQTSECDMIIVPPCGNALLEEEQAGRVVAAEGKVVLRRSVVVR